MKKKSNIAWMLMVLLFSLVLLTGCGGSDGDDSAAVTEASLNSADFSGTWEGTALIAEVKNSEEFKELEDAWFFCTLELDLDSEGSGVANLFLDDQLAGPELKATVVQDRPHLVGELFEGPFEFYGTFSYEEEIWQLTGGGEVLDGEAIFSMVFNLAEAESAGSAVMEEGDPEEPAASTGAPSADAPLDQFLFGTWMGEELFGEYQTRTFNADGTTVFTMDKPGGAGDDINNWPGGGWTIVESARGEWAIVGDLLVAAVEPEHLSVETEVKIIDQNTIEIVELHTKRIYKRVP